MSENLEIIAFLKNKGLSDISPVCAGYHETPSGHTAYGMRPYSLIHYVHEGEGKLEIHGKCHYIKSGEMFFIPEGCDAVYTASRDNPWKYSWIAFVGSYAERFLTLPTPVCAVSSAHFSAIREIDGYKGAKEELCVSAIFAMAAELILNDSYGSDYVKQAEDAARSLYMNGITVAEIADTIGLDRRYLSRIFHEQKGVSLKSFITSVRMSNAHKLLRSGKSVSMTAELVGYNDSFNFSKMFKKYFGAAPSSVKK